MISHPFRQLLCQLIFQRAEVSPGSGRDGTDFLLVCWSGLHFNSSEACEKSELRTAAAMRVLTFFMILYLWADDVVVVSYLVNDR